MSRFYGDLRGRAVATRTGTADSGIMAHPRGWNLGVRVDGSPTFDNPEGDSFTIAITGGSHDARHPTLLAQVEETEDGPILRLGPQLGFLSYRIDPDGSLVLI